MRCLNKVICCRYYLLETKEQKRNYTSNNLKGISYVIKTIDKLDENMIQEIMEFNLKLTVNLLNSGPNFKILNNPDK